MSISRNHKKWLFPFISIILGIVFSILFIELILLTGHYVISNNDKTQINNAISISSNNTSQTIIFSGDSWTYGSDALPNEGFFHQLSRDPEFEQFSMLNLGYPSYNYFQIVNKIIAYKTIPSIVITTGGVNVWHLLGLQAFTEHAKKYLSAEEFRRFEDDYKEQESWFNRLRVYKLFLYILQSTSARPGTDAGFVLDQRKMDELLGTREFWRALGKYRKLYPEYQQRVEHTGGFLKDQLTLTLDQKFYFAAVHGGLTTNDFESSMKKADLFYPEKLNVIPYEVYKNLFIGGKKFNSNISESITYWSLRVLRKWAEVHKVTIFIQTYPEINMPNTGDNTFKNINQIIKKNTKENAFIQIDHNLDRADWPKVATAFHVNTQGHIYMKHNIYKALTSHFETSAMYTRTH